MGKHPLEEDLCQLSGAGINTSEGSATCKRTTPRIRGWPWPWSLVRRTHPLEEDVCQLSTTGINTSEGHGTCEQATPWIREGCRRTCRHHQVKEMRNLDHQRLYRLHRQSNNGFSKSQKSDKTLTNITQACFRIRINTCQIIKFYFVFYFIAQCPSGENRKHSSHNAQNWA